MADYVELQAVIKLNPEAVGYFEGLFAARHAQRPLFPAPVGLGEAFAKHMENADAFWIFFSGALPLKRIHIAKQTELVCDKLFIQTCYKHTQERKQLIIEFIKCLPDIAVHWEVQLDNTQCSLGWEPVVYAAEYPSTTLIAI